MSTAKIVSYNLHGERICASAAKISTTKGNSLELFDASVDEEKNRKLIKKVLGSGHTSLIEHAVFTIAFVDVSAFVEQYLIECRLASFTIKSRRYVDFSNLGYYVPKELSDAGRNRYTDYMNMLFKEYSSLLEIGIPKEDARFLLPYSFSSNFYCTVNARELAHIINSIENDRGRGIPELEDLAEQIKEQLLEILPNFFDLLKPNEKASMNNKKVNSNNELLFVESDNAGGVDLLNFPQNPDWLLRIVNQVTHQTEQVRDIYAILASPRARELEQLTYTFRISDITLSGITHIVRHRMQSIIIPSLKGLNSDRQILPESIQSNSKALEIYKRVVIDAKKIRMTICNDIELANQYHYFLLSGTLTDIITTMNAREMIHFIQLRSCRRAQWEINNIAVRMLELARKNYPVLFNQVGPSCYIIGNCPEGKMSCGKMTEVYEKFSSKGVKK